MKEPFPLKTFARFLSFIIEQTKIGILFSLANDIPILVCSIIKDKNQTKIGILFSLANDIADASITFRSLVNTSR